MSRRTGNERRCTVEKICKFMKVLIAYHLELMNVEIKLETARQARCADPRLITGLIVQPS